MATYSNLGITLITTGDESGTWGTTTNGNFDSILDEAIAGVVTYNISSDANFTLTVVDATSSDARHAVIKFTSTTLSATRTCTFAPNDLQKTWVVINATTGGQSLTFKQGSAGATVTVPNGESAIIYSDGGGASAGAITRVLDSFTNTKITTGTLNATTLDLTNLEVTNIKAKDGTAAATIADSTGVISLSANPTLSGGTANGVLYLNGSKVATSGTGLEFDGTNFGVGTGGNTINNRCVIYRGGANAVYHQVANGSTGLASSNGIRLGLTSGGTGELYSPTALISYIDNAEQMRLTSTGLGIGTSSPGAKFVVSNAGAAGLEVNPIGGVGGGSTIATYNRGTSAYTTLTTYSSAMTWYANGSTRAMDLDSSGNFGIGTSSPSSVSKIDIQIGTSTSNYGLQVRSYDAGTVDGSTTARVFRTVNSGAGNWANAQYDAWSHIWTKSASSELMRLDSSGNLTFSSTGQRITGDMSTATFSNRLAFQTSTANSATSISSLPNGTGTASNINCYNNSDPTNSSLLLAGTNATEALIQSAIRGTGTYLPMTFYTGGSERMRLDTSGNLLAGTTTGVGGNRLTVVGGGTQLSGGTTAQEGVRIQRATGYATFTGINNDNNAYNGLQFFTSASAAATIDTSGNVGIGVLPSTDTLLEVYGSAAATCYKNVNTGTGLSDGFYVGCGKSSSTDAYVYNRESAPLIFGTANAERMRIDSSGNVGIGTASPGTRLTVSSATNAGISVTDGTVTTIMYNSTGGVASIGTTSNHSVNLLTNNTTRVTFDNSGNVGIGGTAQAYSRLNLLGTYPTSSNATQVVRLDGTIPSGTTASYRSFLSRPVTQATAFTLTNLIHFEADPQTLGAGSVVTNQYGFSVADSLTGATNNYGFFSNIASGSNRYNFYAAGTAFNYFAGDTAIGRANSTSVRLFVQGANTGTDYALVCYNSSEQNLFYARNNGEITTGTAASSPYNNTTGSAANVFVTSNGILQRSTSSLRYKTDIADATHGLADVLKLRSVTYKGKNDGEKTFGGLIAEEVHDAGLTEFVAYDNEGRPDALHYGNMVALLVKAIQELEAKVAVLEAK